MPQVYKAPLRDMRFVYEELLDGARLAELPGCAEATPDTVAAILEEAAKLCELELLPLNASGDAEGCRLKNGVVRTPEGFRDAYRLFADAGWTSLACDPEDGGQGLPHAVHDIVQEMVCSANLAFGIYPGLSFGAYQLLRRFGTERLKADYGPGLADGTMAGTMCLTEPQAGTDLGLVRTRAVPQEDGTYAITGNKIFISSGEHDLTDNIIHLVLARAPNAPAGTRGLSLFLVPKVMPDGTRNAVECTGLEHKMGIRASATCSLAFEGASGFLVGDLHAGMKVMFTMMNAARLAVGIQGLGVAETAYQSALAYALERPQGRHPSGARAPRKPADPIAVHPDVRRMLLTMRAKIEGGRALAGWISMTLDRAERHPDAEARRSADDLVALLTPVFKASMTDTGFEAANLCLQIHGGSGFIVETGVEQLVRDVRIAQIYEGTNGIQALDLVGRKLGAHTGRLLRRFFHPVAGFLDAYGEDARLADFTGPLHKAFTRLQRASATIAQRGLADPEEAAAVASDYLDLFALTAMAYMWTLSALVAAEKAEAAGEDERAFYEAKMATARFYMAKVLPRTSALFSTIMAGKETVTEV